MTTTSPATSPEQQQKEAISSAIITYTSIVKSLGREAAYAVDGKMVRFSSENTDFGSQLDLDSWYTYIIDKNGETTNITNSSALRNPSILRYKTAPTFNSDGNITTIGTNPDEIKDPAQVLEVLELANNLLAQILEYRGLETKGVSESFRIREAITDAMQKQDAPSLKVITNDLEVECSPIPTSPITQGFPFTHNLNIRTTTPPIEASMGFGPDSAGTMKASDPNAATLSRYQSAQLQRVALGALAEHLKIESPELATILALRDATHGDISEIVQ